MKKTLFLIIVAMLVAVPAMAQTGGISTSLLQAYPGNSFGANQAFAGMSPGGDVITAVPGVLSIIPGWNDLDGDGKLFEIHKHGTKTVSDEWRREYWSNFIPDAGYYIKMVTLTKDTGTPAQCSDVFTYEHVFQGQTSAIRTWWPLMYEAPGTTWVLGITYTVGVGAKKVVYTWDVDATFESVQSALELFHQLPWGKCEVPLIFDEPTYELLAVRQADPEVEGAWLPGLWAQFVAAAKAGDETAGTKLDAFEFAVGNACATVAVCDDLRNKGPQPTGGISGIVNTSENPACCKLLIDAEWVGIKTVYLGSPK